jgi:Na+-transporting NADH:ubiquinone oxidoreductase subunit NqrB
VGQRDDARVRDRVRGQRRRDAASRADVTFAFLGAWLALHLAYSRWLGQPPAVPLHRFENGALLLFAFFMISDPRTTPETRRGRVVFAVLVAAVALFIQLGLYRTNGLLWSLVLLSPVVPLLNRLWPGPRYAWTRGTPPSQRLSEARHETPGPRRLAPARASRRDPRLASAASTSRAATQSCSTTPRRS